jgi:hypothetical protein
MEQIKSMNGTFWNMGNTHFLHGTYQGRDFTSGVVLQVIPFQARYCIIACALLCANKIKAK